MNLLKKIDALHKNLSEFINNNPETTDYQLKKVFLEQNESDFNNLGVTLYDIVDALIYDKKIERVYPEHSQVAFYKLCA